MRTAIPYQVIFFALSRKRKPRTGRGFALWDRILVWRSGAAQPCLCRNLRKPELPQLGDQRLAGKLEASHPHNALLGVHPLAPQCLFEGQALDAQPFRMRHGLVEQ